MSETSRQDVCGVDAGSALIAAELVKVHDLLISRMTSRAKADEVEQLLQYIGRSGGKMLRPALVLLSGLAAGELVEAHIRAGAIVEMIHTATLLHDDVLDEGQTRRGMPTVNRMRDNETAVLVGDYLLSQAFCMVVRMDARSSRIIADATRQVCEGELRQVIQKHNWDLTENEYLEIITDKSAALFAGSCRVGAHLAGGAEAVIERLTAFGRSAGVAFQITDDLLDLIGDERRVGKTLGTDLDNDKPTLAVIHLLAHCDRRERARVRAMIGAGRGRAELSRMLETAGSLAYARDHARRHVDEALENLRQLAASPARDTLEAMSQHLVERTR